MSLITWLRKEIEEKFNRQGDAGIIIWYDPGGTLATLVNNALPKDVDLLRFEGSYLTMRFKLESNDPSFKKRWLLYIPEKPPDESWLRDIELLGERMEMDLLELLRKRWNFPITQKLVRLLRNNPENAKELADKWGSLIGEKQVTEASLIDAMLALSFGLDCWNMDEALLLYLSQRNWKERLNKRGLWEEWCECIREWTGWLDIPEDENTLRERLQAMVLLSELVTVVPELANRWTIVPSEPKRSVAANLARKWRQREPLSDAYMHAARSVEQAYELSSVLTVSEPLLSAETFYIIDELWKHELRRAIAKNGSNFGKKAERLREIAQSRQRLFWARHDRELGCFWEAISLSASLFIRCRKAVQAADGVGTVQEFIRCYTAEGGWWQLDSWALRLATVCEHLSGEDKERFLHPAWTAYGQYLQYVNRVFADAVERDGWQPTQMNFWQAFRRNRGHKVVFFVDALRYDLAKHLREILAGRMGFEITPVQTMLPSITELGMTALLPDAEKGIEVTVQRNKLSVLVSGRTMNTRAERIEWLKKHLPQGGMVVRLDELERVDLSGVRTLVVLSREVDEFGTFAADLQPQGLLELTERVARAVRYVAEKGFQHIWVVADHGFLFVPPGMQLDTLSAPEGFICKRRFAVGASAKGCLVLEAKAIGLQGDVILAFPKGTSIFGLPGEPSAFLHGGLSLQECVVACLHAKVLAPVQKVKVTMSVPDPVTSRTVSVTIRAQPTTLFDQPRRVKIKIGKQESKPIEVAPDQSQQISLTWLEFDEEPPLKVCISLQDADTGEVLEEKEVSVEIIV